MILIIGSEAMRHNGIHPKKVGNKRRLLDIDMIAPMNEIRAHVVHQLNLGSKLKEMYAEDDGNKVIVKYEDGRIYDIEVAHEGSNQAQLLDLLESPNLDRFPDYVGEGYMLRYASNDLLYMLKMSHRFRKNTPFFKKTMTDIWTLRYYRAKFIPELADWYARREAETYTYKHPKLTVGKAEFFNPNESFYKYDHDTIHLAVKHLDKPAYEYYKPDTSEVHCSQDMFEALPMETRLLGVLEEAYVLALERSQIPNNFEIDRRRSFDIAIEKVCTSITSGWFREFAWEQYDNVVSRYDDNYVDKFQSALENGIIKPFTGNKY